MKFVACVACILAFSNASAGVILDQSFSPGSSAQEAFINTQLNPVERAQTFKVGTSGLLAELDVKVFKRGTVTEPLLVDVRALTSGGAPIEANSGSGVLTSWSVAASTFGSSFLGAGAFVRLTLPLRWQSLRETNLLLCFAARNPELRPPVIDGRVCHRAGMLQEAATCGPQEGGQWKRRIGPSELSLTRPLSLSHQVSY